MMVCQSGRFGAGGSGPITFVAGGAAIQNYLAISPTNPSHSAGDTLLCIGFARGGTMSISGSGWTDADGITNPVYTSSGALYLFQNECDTSSEVNPTLTPAGAASGATTVGIIIRIRGRDFAKNFEVSAATANAISNTQILFPNNSPNILNGDGILAIGTILNDCLTGVPDTLNGEASGVTFTNLATINTTTGSDMAAGIQSAVNSSGSTYNAGTAAAIENFTVQIAVTSVGVYLRIPA